MVTATSLSSWRKKAYFFLSLLCLNSIPLLGTEAPLLESPIKSSAEPGTVWFIHPLKIGDSPDFVDTTVKLIQEDWIELGLYEGSAYYIPLHAQWNLQEEYGCGLYWEVKNHTDETMQVFFSDAESAELFRSSFQDKLLSRAAELAARETFSKIKIPTLELKERVLEGAAFKPIGSGSLTSHAAFSFMKVGHKSLPGTHRGGAAKINQDAVNRFIYARDSRNAEGYMHVLDGHGLNGQTLALGLSDLILKGIYESLQKNPGDHLWAQRVISAALLNAEKIAILSPYCTALSGSTYTGVVVTPTYIKVANIGDSRAVLGSIDSNSRWHTTQLTSDHCVSSAEHLPLAEEKEAERINANGGRLYLRTIDHFGPEENYRVAITQQTFQRLVPSFAPPTEMDILTPRLIPTRSLADTIGKLAGISSCPQFTFLSMDPSHRFVIVASDGVWDVLSNEEVTAIVSRYYSEVDAMGAAAAVVEAARVKYEATFGDRDDISAVVMFFMVRKNQSPNENILKIPFPRQARIETIKGDMGPPPLPPKRGQKRPEPGSGTPLEKSAAENRR